NRVGVVGGAAERAHQGAIVCVAETNERIACAGDDKTRVSDVADRGHLFAEAANRSLLLAGDEVPNLYRVVGATACQHAPVGSPAHVENVMRVPFERTGQRPGVDVVNLDELVGS